jgi:hypothetical protein
VSSDPEEPNRVLGIPLRTSSRARPEAERGRPETERGRPETEPTRPETERTRPETEPQRVLGFPVDWFSSSAPGGPKSAALAVRAFRRWIRSLRPGLARVDAADDVLAGDARMISREREGGEVAEAELVPEGVDPSKPSPARMYDYMLGGTHNLQVDRIATERFRASMPDLEDAAWANRGFHGRAARWIAEQGVRQFIDIGSGLPTQNNTHETLRQILDDAHVAYVDSDPMVLVYARELLTEDGTTAVIQADLRDPRSVLDNPDLRAVIDLSQPVGLLMTAVLQFVADSSDPWGLVKRYVDASAPGSYLALSHITGDRLPPQSVQTGVDVYGGATESAYPRTKAEIERFFDGLELVPPYAGAGQIIVNVGQWGAEDPVAGNSDGAQAFYCGVGRRS